MTNFGQKVIRGTALLAASFLVSLSPVVAQDIAQTATQSSPVTNDVAPVSPTPPPAANPTEYAYVALTTSLGSITLALDKTHAPITTGNFLKYVDGKRLDGATFYRAMHLDWGDEPAGLLQGGLQGLPGKVLPPIAHEPTNVTGLSHKAGTISMARFAPGSATADFTIMINDITSLDAQPESEDPSLKAGFAAFGHVVAGMDVVKAIWNTERSPTKGEGVMRGQILSVPVKIISAHRSTAP